jgi:hypothetical protein
MMLLIAFLVAGYGQQAANPGADAYQRLHWRYVGPEGNRFSAVAGIPGDPGVYYAGSASGGVYKTTDGGVHWQPVFDAQPVQSIGSLAVAKSDPNIVWAGTGEGKIRSHISVGQGIYKSTDAGKTWAMMGLEQTGRIPRIVTDPKTRCGLCLRPRPRLWAPAGSRRLPYHRRRQYLDQGALRR